MCSTSILIFLFVFFIYYIIKTYKNKKWHKKPLRNFPFMYKGKIFWYSRSVATTGLVLCKDKENNEWCVLANQRGEGAPDYKGFWNIPCGYLEHGVSGEENIVKEILEETGVFIPSNKMIFHSLSTSPKENKQNVSIRYFTILNGNCDMYPLTDENSEPNEVIDIKWIPISKIDEYNWAFNHLNLIKEMSSQIINNL